MWHIVVLMLVGVAHIRAIEDQGVIEQRSITVRNGLQLLEEVHQHLHVISIDLGVIGYLLRTLGVMRTGVESGISATGRIVSVGQITCAEKRRDARNVRLKCQGRQVVLQLDVLVEGLRDSNRNGYRWKIGGCFSGDFEATLDLADVFGVLIETGAISGSDRGANAAEAFGDNIQDASLLTSSSGAFFRIAAVAKE